MNIDTAQVAKLVVVFVGCWASGYFAALGRIYVIKVMEKI